MISNYPDVAVPWESQVAYNLVAAVITRARADIDGKDYQLQTCVATYNDHHISRCARAFIDRLINFQSLHPEADHIEIAIEVLEWLR